MAFGKLFGPLARPQAGELGPLALTGLRHGSTCSLPCSQAGLAPARESLVEAEWTPRGQKWRGGETASQMAWPASPGSAVWPRSPGSGGVRVPPTACPGSGGEAEGAGGQTQVPIPPLPQGLSSEAGVLTVGVFASLPGRNNPGLSRKGTGSQRGRGHGATSRALLGVLPAAARSRPGRSPRYDASEA